MEKIQLHSLNRCVFVGFRLLVIATVHYRPSTALYALCFRDIYRLPHVCCTQIGASTFSTNVGAPMFLGMAGSAAATGLAITMFEWHVSVAYRRRLVTIPC